MHNALMADAVIADALMADALSWQARLVAMATMQDDDGAVDGAHDLNHLHRVWASARTLMREEAMQSGAAPDPRVVIAACYLHDLINLPKNHPKRAGASRLSAARARTLLAGAGFPVECLDGVAHAIEAHSFSARIAPCSIEAKIVQDADRLDALGAVGLARLFHIAGQMGSSLAHGADPLACKRPLDDRRYALDHIVVKLAALPALMKTAAGRALAQQRLARLLDFRAAFAEEWGASPEATS
jgi:uncharacterized protein